MTLLAGQAGFVETEPGTGIAKERASAYQFTAAVSGTMEAIVVLVAKAMGTATNVQVAIMTDVGGVPTTIIGTRKALGHAPVEGANEWTGMEGSLVAGTTYWLVLLPFGTLKLEVRTGAVKNRLSEKAVENITSSMAWLAASEPSAGPNFRINGTESGVTGTLKASTTIVIAAAGKVAASASLRPTASSVLVTGSSRLSAVASLRASTVVTVVAQAKLSTVAALAALTKIIVTGVANIVTTAGGIVGELRASTVVKVVGAGRLATVARLKPSAVVVIPSQARLTAAVSLKGSALVTVPAQGRLAATVSLIAHSPVIVVGSAKITAKAALRLAGNVLIGATARLATTQVGRRGLVLYARVTAPAEIPSEVIAGQIPAVVTPAAQIPLTSQVE